MSNENERTKSDIPADTATPETDAKVELEGEYTDIRQVVAADFARRLERERDQVIHDFDDIKRFFVAAQKDLSALRRDRDGLAALCEELKRAFPFPAISSGSAKAIAFEIEQGADAKHTTTPHAKSMWLRSIAARLDALEMAMLATPEQALQRKEGASHV